MKNTDFILPGLASNFAKNKAASTAQPNVKPSPAPVSAPVEAANLVESSNGMLVFIGALGFMTVVAAGLFFAITPGSFQRFKNQIMGKKEPDQQGFSGPKYGVLFDRTA